MCLFNLIYKGGAQDKTVGGTDEGYRRREQENEMGG